MSQHNPKSNNDIPEFCYLQISIGGQVQPRPIVIHLQHETCPKTCRNFLALCSSSGPEEEEEEIKKVKTTRKKPMPTYRGSYFHRIVPNFMCQAGDFERFDGTGGYSPIHPGGRFDDEPFLKKHDAEGVVSMANAGKNTNKSQFFITLKATPHLDGKHVAFGRVVSGMESVHAMTKVEREGDRPVPLQRIEICDCGIGKGSDDDNNNNKSNKQQDEDGKQDNAKGSSTPRDSDRKRNKKKHKKRSKSKRRNHDDDPDDDDDGNRHRDRKKRRRKHHRSRKDEDSDDSYSDASSSSGRDGDHSCHDGRKHRSRSSDGRRRRKHSKQHGRKKIQKVIESQKKQRQQ